jgi:hypothetical protein
MTGIASIPDLGVFVGSGGIEVDARAGWLTVGCWVGIWVGWPTVGIWVGLPPDGVVLVPVEPLPVPLEPVYPAPDPLAPEPLHQ